MKSAAQYNPTPEPFYIINLYTWLTDKQAALELARRVAELVGPIPEIDELATTVSDEEDPAAEPDKTFRHLVNPGMPLNGATTNALRPD